MIFVREMMLVADALRLGGAILGNHPDMLAPQLVGRLLPEIGNNVNVRMLLKACDNDGAKDCALLPLYHCLHTPGGPLKVRSYSFRYFTPSLMTHVIVFPVLFGGAPVCRLRVLLDLGLSLHRFYIEQIHHLGPEHQRHD